MAASADLTSPRDSVPASPSRAAAGGSSLFRLTGQLALVTGSTLGIGKAAAKALIEAGADVIINGRSQSKVDEVLEELRASAACAGGRESRVMGVAADVGTARGAETIRDFVESVGRPLSILVCNAGVYEPKDFFETTDEDWAHYHEVNVMSVVRLARIFLKDMLERGEGRVIIVASEAGIKPLPHMLAYSVSKTTLVGLSRGLAELTKGSRVTVNSVLAGPTATEGVTKYFESLAETSHRSVEEVVSSYFKDTEPTSLIQRLITVDEVAAVIVFLASAAAAAVNGSSQRVEGGTIRHI